MDGQDDLDAMVRRAREAVRRDLAGGSAQLDRALTEQALYVAANRYVVVARQGRRGESSQELLRARQRSLAEAALAYAHARGWQPPADWEPPAGDDNADA
jgi:hypothetical protein